MRPTRAERQRRRLAAEIRARARVLPEASDRIASSPSRIHAPFRDVVDAYQQTPESWRAVWEDE